ncbi:Relaxin receptor 1 [Melipona quadrifasciata]|uniref:Relaxin receptor 1 n=1 Tax=Melipona quadrifasciata TaxID=166423 RepID=A0A0M9AA14_9HYME|nr:Relaxin receptor 1 [Melipona quadrifasciata]
MRYKYIGAIGAVLIAIVCLLSGLMYYFNQVRTCGVPFTMYKTQRVEPRDIKNVTLYADDYHGVLDWFGSDRDSEAVREFVCDATDIPVGCKYVKCRATCQGTLYDSSIKRVPTGAFARYSEIRILYLDGSDIHELEEGAFLNLTKLFWLALDNNQISKLRPGHFAGLTNLESLRANKNRIAMADFSDLEGSGALNFINLNENQLTSKGLRLPELPALNEILLDENNFETIPDTLFAGCPSLKLLYVPILFADLRLTSNINTVAWHQEYAKEQDKDDRGGHVSKFGAAGRTAVGLQPSSQFTDGCVDSVEETLLPVILREFRDLEGIELDMLQKNAFDTFGQLDFVYFKKFHYCATYAPRAKRCRPTSDGVSSLSHLLDKTLLRAAVWIISCVTCMGNVLVLWGRFTAKDENRVLTIIIRNLAVSDMLMGLYLFVIAIADVIFRDNYNRVASSWMSSWFCTFVGVLAMTSLEVSVLILSFMSVERYMLIAAPLKGHRNMTPQTAFASVIIIWITGIALALMPVIHWRSSTRFYGVNGVCFPLHIDDPYLIGWEYSAFVFLGLNLTGLLVIGYAYAAMFVSIWRTRHACSLSVGDSEFALRFFLIVLTDAACWAPIIILKIRAMMKYPISADLHAWVVVFILPVNSAVNPLLYTFTTPKFRERLNDGWFAKVRNYMTRRKSSAKATCNATVLSSLIRVPVTADSRRSTSVSNRNIMLSLSNGKGYINKIPPTLEFNKEKTQQTVQ